MNNELQQDRHPIASSRARAPQAPACGANRPTAAALAAAAHASESGAPSPCSDERSAGVLALLARRACAARHAMTVFLVAFTALFAAGAQAQTETTLVSSLGESGNASGTLGGSNERLSAQKFTVGPDSDYILTEVTINVTGTSSAGVNVAIHVVDGSNPAASSLHALTTPSGTGAGNRTYTAAADATLEAGERYFVVVTGPSGDVRGIGLTTSDNQSGENGWAISDTRRTRQGGTWSNDSHVVRMRLKGRAISTDATLSDLELENPDDDTGIPLTPAFAMATESYTASVANGVDEITVLPETNDDGATVGYLDAADMTLTDSDSMEDDFQVALAVGANTIKVKVTAEDTPPPPRPTPWWSPATCRNWHSAKKVQQSMRTPAR